MSDSVEIKGEFPSIEMVSPDEGDAYTIVARDLINAVEVLSNATTIHPRGCALLAGHALECILKLFLWHKGERTKINKPEIRHNILELWKLVYSKNDLGISQDPPIWVRLLSFGHGPNFFFRYQEGENKTIVNGGSYPPLESLSKNLRYLFDKVNKHISAKNTKKT